MNGEKVVFGISLISYFSDFFLSLCNLMPINADAGNASAEITAG